MFPHTVPVRFWNDLLYSMTLASVLVMTFLGEASTNWGLHDGGLHRCGHPGHGDLRVFAAVLHPGFHRRCGERIRQTFPALSLLIAPSALLLPRSVSGWSAQNRSLYTFLFLLIFGKQRKHRMFGASAVCASICRGCLCWMAPAARGAVLPRIHLAFQPAFLYIAILRLCTIHY